MRFLGSCAGEGPARQTEAAESDVVFGRHGGPSMIARNASRETLSAWCQSPYVCSWGGVCGVR